MTMINDAQQPLPMPKTTSPVAAKAYRALAKAYDTIAEIFQEGIVNEIDAGRLVAEADAGQAVWRDVRSLQEHRKP